MALDRSTESTTSVREPGAPGGERPRPVFWNELYWFVLICLGAWILGMLLLTPRLEKSRQASVIENRLDGVLQKLAAKEREYEEAILAMENDPFYRAAVYRMVLGVNKKDEINLKNIPEVSDN
jgi:hypothetical protein